MRNLFDLTIIDFYCIAQSYHSNWGSEISLDSDSFALGTTIVIADEEKVEVLSGLRNQGRVR